MALIGREFHHDRHWPDFQPRLICDRVNKGATPLHVAILALYSKRYSSTVIHQWVYERIRWLVEAGADVSTADSRGTSCLDLALRIKDHVSQND